MGNTENVAKLASDGNLEKIILVTPRDDRHHDTYNGLTAVEQAVKNGNYAIFKCLIQKGFVVSREAYRIIGERGYIGFINVMIDATGVKVNPIDILQTYVESDWFVLDMIFDVIISYIRRIPNRRSWLYFAIIHDRIPVIRKLIDNHPSLQHSMFDDSSPNAMHSSTDNLHMSCYELAKKHNSLRAIAYFSHTEKNEVYQYVTKRKSDSSNDGSIYGISCETESV